jgi:hypothetical protein
MHHIRDWLKEAIAKKEPWLEEKDDKGRIIVLREISTIESAIERANKALSRKSRLLVEEKAVDPRYIPYVQNFIRAMKLDIASIIRPANTYLAQMNGEYYDFNSFPEGFVFDGDLKLDGTKGIKLPKNFTATNLDLINASIELPEGLHVPETILLENTECSRLPTGLRAGMILPDPHNFTSMGSNIHIVEGLILYNIRIEDIGLNLKVDGNLVLHRTGKDINTPEELLDALPKI